MRLILADKRIATPEALETGLGSTQQALEVVTATSVEEIRGHLLDGGLNVVLVSDAAGDLEALRQALSNSFGCERPLVLVTQGWRKKNTSEGVRQGEAGGPPVMASPMDWIGARQAGQPESGGTLPSMPVGEWLCALSTTVEEAVLRVRGGRLAEIDGAFADKMGFAAPAPLGARVGRLFAPADRRALYEWLKRSGEPGAGTERERSSIRLAMRGEKGEHPVTVSRVPSTEDAGSEIVLLVDPLAENALTQETWDLLVPTDLDALTGLPGDAWFQEAVRQAIVRAKRAREGCCVLACRMEGLQAIERDLGSEAAREACQTAAIRLRRAAGPSAALARLGPHEFGCVFVSSDPQSVTEQHILRFQRVIRPPVTGGPVPMPVWLRFGISEYSDQMERPRALVKLARTRAAVARLLAHPLVRSTSRGMFKQGTCGLEQELERACERDEFELFLQPIIHLRSFAIRGAEVLVRWRHPERGLLSPAHFLPMAESTGQISRIGQWVLEAVCAQAMQWSRLLQHKARFAVNVSPVELHDNRFLANTLAILGKHSLHPVEIELEITETAVLASEQKTAEVVEQLRRQGVKVALDDFGVGYSSLSHLREIPFSKLKIDRTFVHGAPGSHRCRTIVRSMVELARGLRIEVNGEGVENPEQLRFLYESGCDEVQGYLFARPMSPARFASWVAGYQGKAMGALPEQAGQDPHNKVVPFVRGRLSETHT